jgi:hypothetical protein
MCVNWQHLVFAGMCVGMDVCLQRFLCLLGLVFTGMTVLAVFNVNMVVCWWSLMLTGMCVGML